MGDVIATATIGSVEICVQVNFNGWYENASRHWNVALNIHDGMKVMSFYDFIIEYTNFKEKSSCYVLNNIAFDILLFFLFVLALNMMTVILK